MSSTLYTTLPHYLIKEILTELTEQILIERSSIYLACNEKKNVFFSLLISQSDMIHGQVREFVFWITYLLDVVLNCIDKLLVFLLVLIVPLLLQICFCFVIRETSC